MAGGLNAMGKDRALAMFADWTDRMAGGELPPAPPRPQGVERNVVITQWDWADPKAYLHDQVSTDRRNPTINANGLIYGSLELSADYLPVLDPVRNTISQVPLTVRDPNTPRTPATMPKPSPYWGEEAIWTSRNNVHNPMFDEKGRVWITSAVRPAPNPDFCKEGSSHPSAKLYPLANSRTPARRLRSGDQTDHAHQHLLRHAPPDVRGGREPDAVDERRRTGRRLAEHEDVRRDARRGEVAGLDRAHHGHQRQRQARRVRRAEPAARSHEGQTLRQRLLCRRAGARWIDLGIGARVPRLGRPAESRQRILPRRRSRKSTSRRCPAIHRAAATSIATASTGPRSRAVTWRASIAANASGPLNGPKATGQHCPEGWTLYAEPLPQLKGVTDPGSAEASYYTWVDWHDTLGLGANVPIDTGNASEGLLALKDGKWVVLRVPYPTGFYTKWMDGRIDDPKAGWKGRGLCATISTRTPFHMETGKGTTSKVMHFQMRPDPLAK